MVGETCSLWILHGHVLKTARLCSGPGTELKKTVLTLPCVSVCHPYNTWVGCNFAGQIFSNFLSPWLEGRNASTGSIVSTPSEQLWALCSAGPSQSGGVRLWLQPFTAATWMGESRYSCLGCVCLTSFCSLILVLD